MMIRVGLEIPVPHAPPCPAPPKITAETKAIKAFTFCPENPPKAAQE
jgi:hypothetical protein